MILASAFLSGLLLIGISALVGYFVTHFRENINISKATLLGLILIVVIYSLFKTTFYTLNILCVPLLIYFLLSQSSKKESTLKANFLLIIRENILYFIIVHFFSFLYFTYLYFDFDLFAIKYVWYDTVYYSNLSRGIDSTCIENLNSVFYQFSKSEKITLYHYFDVWLNIIVTKISGLNHYSALVLVTYPVLLSTFYFILIDRFKRYKNQILIFIILLPITVNIPFFLDKGAFNIHGLHLNILSIKDSKILINYILILAGSFALLEKNIREFLIYFLLLVIFYSTTIVSIIPAVGLILLIITINRKYLKTTKRKLYKYFYIYFFFILSIVLLVFLITDRKAGPDSFQFVIASSKTAFIVFIEYCIKYSLAYIFVILSCGYTLFAIYRKKLLQENVSYIFVLMFVILIAFCGILFASVFHGANTDYAQSISNILVCCFTTLLIISYYTLHTKLNFKLNWFFYVFVFGIAICNVYQSIDHKISYPHKYSNEFKKNVLMSFKKIKSPKYISISKGDNERKVCKEGCYITNRTNGFLAQVDNISVGIDFTYDLNFINQIDSFYQRVKAEKITHIFTSKDILINIPHKKLIVDSITKQKVYCLY